MTASVTNIDESRPPVVDTLKVLDKVSGSVIEELPVNSPERVTEMVENARRAGQDWSQLSVKERVKYIKRARNEVAKGRTEIFSLLERESGKARADVVGELLSVCMDIGHIASKAPGWLKTRKVGTAPLFGKKGRIVYKPHGVVGVISPWNAPLTLSLGDAVPALLAGNSVVIKPSELTPLAVKRTIELMNRVLPPSVLQVAIGEGAAGQALVDHVDMICVTGSPQTGRRVMARASQRLTPVLLELGGKDPMIVLEDADLDRAAAGATFGSLLMGGQVCMSVERVYVEAAVAAEFIDKVVENFREIRVGANGIDAEIDYGPFTSANQVNIVESQLKDALEKGATVLIGGKRTGEGAGVYFAPTVVTNVDHSMEIMKEETFGPVLAIQVVKDSHEAIELANDCQYGLNSSVGTRNIARGIEVAKMLEVGNTCVNECVLSAGVQNLNFGGVKASGLGFRHGGPEGLRQFAVPQSLLIETRRRKTEFPWFPYAPKQAGHLDKLIGLMYGR